MKRGPFIRVYRDSKREWRWRFVNRRKTMADSGEGYKRKGACLRSLRSVMARMGGARVEVEGEE